MLASRGMLTLKPGQRPNADPGSTRRDAWQAAAVISNDSFAPIEEFPGLAVLTLAVLKGGEPSRFDDDRSKFEHVILSLASVLLHSLYGIRSRLGELRLAQGIMPVPTAETEPTGQAKPSKPAKPFAHPLMAKFLGKAVVKPVVESNDDGESDGIMSEGEIRLAAAAITDSVKACGQVSCKTLSLPTICSTRQNKNENTDATQRCNICRMK
jgi:hypothetical protein